MVNAGITGMVTSKTVANNSRRAILLIAAVAIGAAGVTNRSISGAAGDTRAGLLAHPTVIAAQIAAAKTNPFHRIVSSSRFFYLKGDCIE
ncbi:MAG: hypothetical protein AAB460_03500 [Patescibacteria group bacterium]